MKMALTRQLFSGNRLRARSLRATALTTGGFGLQKVIQLGSNMILTRILFPEAFGLMALVTVFVTGLTLLSDVGIQASLIRSTRSEDPVFQATSWTLQAVRGLWITVLAWLLAWPYALIYDQALLFPLICVSALAPSVAGFKSIQMAMQQRKMILGRVVALQVVGQALAVGLTILFAWVTQSVWGLAIGNVVGALAKTLLSHLLLPSGNHRFVWDRAVLREIMKFGRWILLGTLLSYLGGRGIQAVRGALTDLETLAFLQIAAMFAWMLTDLTKAVLSSVVYPVLSEFARTRSGELRRTVGRIRSLQLLAVLPAFAVLALLADPLIDLLYDDRYLAAGGFLTLLAMNGAIGAIGMVYQNAFLALGDSRIHAMIMGVMAGTRIVATTLGFFLGGPMGMIVGDGLAALVTTILTLGIAYRKGVASLRVDVASMAVVILFYAIVYWNLL